QMIDEKYKVRRYIAEYSEETEDLVAEHELLDFELDAFKKEFDEANPDQPMFGCYPVLAANTDFLNPLLVKPISWDFDKSSYFVEAHAI
ncbi:DUF7683 domain-containing protein, partial [Vibrio chagasii]|uniref:DUF7683 domain-containing protein n=1 Tax=Vibrio chagasii TaxID=170679 RepID=UPI002284DB1C